MMFRIFGMDVVMNVLIAELSGLVSPMVDLYSLFFHS